MVLCEQPQQQQQQQAQRRYEKLGRRSCRFSRRLGGGSPQLRRKRATPERSPLQLLAHSATRFDFAEAEADESVGCQLPATKRRRISESLRSLHESLLKTFGGGPRKYRLRPARRQPHTRLRTPAAGSQQSPSCHRATGLCRTQSALKVAALSSLDTGSCHTVSTDCRCRQLTGTPWLPRLDFGFDCSQTKLETTPKTKRSGGSCRVGGGREIPVKQGWLLKASSSGLSRKKKFVTLSQDGQLSYHASLQLYMHGGSCKRLQLVSATVKVPGQHRPTASGSDDSADSVAFSVVSMDGRAWRFEAASGEERDGWVRDIQAAILRSLQGGVGVGVGGSGGSGGSAIRRVAGNDACADCDAASPEWASASLGVTLCIECSGAHRQLGTHLSRVRSLQLDEWPAEQAELMLAAGNRLANSVWEAAVPASAKPRPDAERTAKEKFVRDKYQRRLFLPPSRPSVAEAKELLADALVVGDTRQVLLCLAVGGAEAAGWRLADGRSPLHVAAGAGLAGMLQLLLWYGADPRLADAEGHDAAWHAAAAGAGDCELLLLRASRDSGQQLSRTKSAAALSAS